MIAEPMAAISTEAAAKSFTCPIMGSSTGFTRSHKSSKDVFKVSVIQTLMIAPIKKSHSMVCTWKYAPATITSTVDNKWIHILCCVLMTRKTPLMAYLKLRHLFFMQNDLDIRTCTIAWWSTVLRKYPGHCFTQRYVWQLQASFKGRHSWLGKKIYQCKREEY